jgi:DNA (cytosine-5)-methyltransferase 1
MAKNLRFVDLFAGIGGFHQALEQLGCRCVCASEIDPHCIETYKKNFPDTPIVGDINECFDELPDFDIMCGGFPCQPFSKAGKQEGFKDKKSGNLFYVLMDILKRHPECKFVILENVKNLADNSQNWEKIQAALQEQDFYVTDEPIILSPHQIGIPQIRERVYILGIRKGIRDDSKLPNGSIHMEDLGKLFDEEKVCKGNDAKKILTKNVDRKYIISKQQKDALLMWMEFKNGTSFETLGVPIWVEYFGYGLSDKAFETFVDYKGQSIDEMFEWKKRFVRKNRAFYKKHKTFIDDWIKKYDVLNLPMVYKKFEWNCGKNRDIKNTIIQFRQSGIRVKRLNYFPALVAINNTPVIYDDEFNDFRMITPREAANLQSFKEDYDFNGNPQIYKQLGNAVNVEIVKILAEKLFSFAKQESLYEKT